jgi:hypothetical protein
VNPNKRPDALECDSILLLSESILLYAGSHLWRLPEVFSFAETLLQPCATGNAGKNINVISEYDKIFCRKGPENRLFLKSGVSG